MTKSLLIYIAVMNVFIWATLLAHVIHHWDDK